VNLDVYRVKKALKVVVRQCVFYNVSLNIKGIVCIISGLKIQINHLSLPIFLLSAFGQKVKSRIKKDIVSLSEDEESEIIIVLNSVLPKAIWDGK